MSTRRAHTEPDSRSLATLWAHLLGDEGEIEYQVEILRPGPPGTWIVQYYSFMGGDPTSVGVVPEATLLDDEKCVLYLDAEGMRFAHEYGSLGHHSRRVLDARIARERALDGVAIPALPDAKGGTS